MHLGLYNIHATRTAILQHAIALQIVNCPQRRYHSIQKPFGNRLSIRSRHRIGVHVNAHISHQQRTSSRQCQCTAIWSDILPIGIQSAIQGLSILFKSRLQRALHQTTPVAIHAHLVRSIHSRYGILTILNRGNSRLQHHIFHSRRMLFSNGMIRIDLNLNMQSIVRQQHTGQFPISLRIAHKLLGI